MWNVAFASLKGRTIMFCLHKSTCWENSKRKTLRRLYAVDLPANRLLVKILVKWFGASILISYRNLSLYCLITSVDRIPFNLPRPGLDKSDSYQVSIAKQVPQVISLFSFLGFSFCLHTLYSSFWVLRTICFCHFTQDCFSFFHSSSSWKPARRLRNKPMVIKRK